MVTKVPASGCFSAGLAGAAGVSAASPTAAPASQMAAIAVAPSVRPVPVLAAGVNSRQYQATPW